MNELRAYHELVCTLLDEEEQDKFEWIIGAMLSGGSGRVVVFRGARGSGKSTLLNIIRKTLLSPFTGNTIPRVVFHYEENLGGVDPDAFTFVETLNVTGSELSAVVIETTGERLPVNRHYVLMNEIDNELVAISKACIARYRALGDDYFNTFEENNR